MSCFRSSFLYLHTRYAQIKKKKPQLCSPLIQYYHDRAGPIRLIKTIKQIITLYIYIYSLKLINQIGKSENWLKRTLYIATSTTFWIMYVQKVRTDFLLFVCVNKLFYSFFVDVVIIVIFPNIKYCRGHKITHNWNVFRV